MSFNVIYCLIMSYSYYSTTGCKLDTEVAYTITPSATGGFCDSDSKSSLINTCSQMTGNVM